MAQPLRSDLFPVALAIALLSLSAWAASGPLEPVSRIVAGGLVLTVLGWHLSARRRVLMLSPLLLLGLNGIVFYALVPAIVFPFASTVTQWDFYLGCSDNSITSARA